MIIACPVCNTAENIEHSIDKAAWRCEGCHRVFEYNFQTNNLVCLEFPGARFTKTFGGNICTGFGGLPGEV